MLTDNSGTRAPATAQDGTLPLVSCICPTFGRPPSHQYLIEEAIESFLRQTYPNKELIVLNDCGAQELICHVPGVRVINVPDRFPSLGDKRNAGVLLSAGEFIAPWDDDDISLPWRLSHSVERLRDGDYYNPYFWWLLDGTGLHLSHGVGLNMSLFRRSAWETVGGHPSITLGEDQVMDQKFRAAVRFVSEPQPGCEEWRASERFYIYRWGVSQLHLSTHEESWENTAKLPIEPGRFVLQPHWRVDYEAETLRVLTEGETLSGPQQHARDDQIPSYSFERGIVSSPYDEQFYAYHRSGALNAARAVVPHMMGLIRPRSVVDVGCGTGEWLAAFREHGITDVLGIDGDWVPREQLQIPQNLFTPHDLRYPLHLERTFDCAVSLETGGHLPPECAATFVTSLVSLAPVVLFSAALPDQGGLDHLNEQWPSYWSDLFAEHGYMTIDCVRPLICNSPDVPYWYVWNVLLFAERSYVGRHKLLKVQYEVHGGPPLPWVDSNFWSGGPDSWSTELRRMRNAWKAETEVELQEAAALLPEYLDVERDLERDLERLVGLVGELRDERNAWKRQAKRHEEAAKELRGLLRGQGKKKKRRKDGTGTRSR